MKEAQFDFCRLLKRREQEEELETCGLEESGQASGWIALKCPPKPGRSRGSTRLSNFREYMERSREKSLSLSRSLRAADTGSRVRMRPGKHSQLERTAETVDCQL